MASERSLKAGESTRLGVSTKESSGVAVSLLWGTFLSTIGSVLVSIFSTGAAGVSEAVVRWRALAGAVDAVGVELTAA